MHPNQAFRTADKQKNLAFARDRAFGTLAECIGGAPVMSHVPYLLSDDGGTLDLHLVRSNPIARTLDSPVAARIAISGPDSYVSPDWYEVSDQVPTWNYVAVHLTGTLELRPQGELPQLLARQSAFFENRLAPKPPWTMDKVAPDTLEKFMRMIVPCKMQITEVAGTWKLNQNKDDDARLRAADQVGANGIGAETRLLSVLMRNVRD